MKERIYVCHTYYHIYVALLKELALPKEKRRQATMVLSTITMPFEHVKERLEKLDFFEEVVMFDEKPDYYFEELMELRKDQGNIVKNMRNRMKLTKRYGELEEPFVPVDFSQYGDIYIFCDSDPIGYYLNYKHIRYHAVEDGLNCLKMLDAARYDNRGFFPVKAFMSSVLNLVFVQNGYGKYCIDMEVNDRKCLKYDYHKYVEVPRKALEDRLTDEDKDIIIRAFLENVEELKDLLAKQEPGQKNAIVLTERLCTEDVRRQIFQDIIREYCDGYRVFIKPHPKDTMDYEKEFPEHIVMKGNFPLEVMKYIEGVHFHRAVAVLTQAIETMDFVDERLFLGMDFFDKYEKPELHRYNEQI